jgi:hypothetical protein
MQPRGPLVWTSSAENGRLRLAAWLSLLPGLVAVVALVLVAAPRNSALGPLCLAGSVSLLVFVLLRMFSVVHVRVDGAGVQIEVGTFPRWKTTVPLGEIANAEVIELRPMEWGGWGYRGSLRWFDRAAASLQERQTLSRHRGSCRGRRCGSSALARSFALICVGGSEPRSLGARLRRDRGRRRARVNLRAAWLGGVRGAIEPLVEAQVVSGLGVPCRDGLLANGSEVGEAGVPPPSRFVVLDLKEIGHIFEACGVDVPFDRRPGLAH